MGPGKNSKKILEKVSKCRKWVIPYLYTLRRTLGYAYTLPKAIAYLNTCIPYLNTCITYLNTLTRPSTPCIAYLNTLSRLHILIHELLILIHCPTIPYLNTLSRTIPYLNTLSRTIPYLNTLSRTHPACAENRKNVSSQSESSTKKPFNFVSQSESCFTSPELSANQNRVLHHSAANQIRVLRNTSRQPIRIRYYVTRELSARVEVPSRLSDRVGSL